MTTAIILVDHGSRLKESNQLLEEVARQFADRFSHKYRIVEPAHMEMAEPSIATAYSAAVARGATHIIVCPFFLGPGKHWSQDIPRLIDEAAATHPGITHSLARTLGVDDLMLDLLDKRASACRTD